MNNKGQGELELILLIFGAVLVAGLVIALVTTSQIEGPSSSGFKFCEAWAMENEVNLIEVEYGWMHLDKGDELKCTYSALPEVFDGVIESPSEKNKIYFEISEQALLEWSINKKVSKDCCQECC